jgi:hypothetical protein
MSGASRVSRRTRPTDAAHVGLVDLLGGGEFRDGRVRAVLLHFAPAECLGDRYGAPTHPASEIVSW